MATNQIVIGSFRYHITMVETQTQIYVAIPQHKVEPPIPDHEHIGNL